MATEPRALLLCSPYARRGALWEAYDRHYGKDGEQGATRRMNPTVDERIMAEALRPR